MPDNNQIQLEQTRSEKFVSIYSNSANVEATPWDFRIVFGELQKTGAGQISKIEQHVAVTMSPQHAKALLGVLHKNVTEYEKHVGEIKLPPDPQKDANANEPKLI
jgi:hypothetical protein